MTNIYETKDFYLSGFLIAEGVKLLSHRRNGAITTFSFNDNEMLKQLIKKYYAMQSLVEPMTYSNALRSLKSVLHSNNYANVNGGINNHVQQFGIRQ